MSVLVVSVDLYKMHTEMRLKLISDTDYLNNHAHYLVNVLMRSFNIEFVFVARMYFVVVS